MYSELGLFIDGRWRGAADRETEGVVNPATGKIFASLPHSTTNDLDAAIEAAQSGFSVWRNTSPYDRSKVLRAAASLVRERADYIARVLVQEQGKPIAEAKGEVLFAADILDWYAEEGRRAYGRIVPGRRKGTRQMVVQEPVGIVAAFTPWNFPIMTPARKIGAALGAGCSIIIKPSEETPGSCVELVRCLADAGVPDGVLNLVFGVPAKVSEYLITADPIRKLSFTGSVSIGKQLAGLAAKGMKRTTMELGGHAPVVVFADVDPEKVADTLAALKYRNAGQVCISPTRFYVQEGIYKKFADRFTDCAKAIRIGDGLDQGTTMGPLANPRRLDAMEDIVRDAKERGGRIATGGNRHGNQGFFFEPTVITDLPDDAKLMTEEPFGPIAPIVPFKAFEEVVDRANSLPFGLAAYAFTGSSQTAIAIGDALEAGMVGINSVAISTPETPFGGVKESGYGHEGGIEGFEAYTNKKLICQA